MNIEVTLENYERLLKRHDWAYEYSDDHQVWLRGRDEHAVLVVLQQALDPEFTLWNQHAPTDYQLSNNLRNDNEHSASPAPNRD